MKNYNPLRAPSGRYHCIYVVYTAKYVIFVFLYSIYPILINIKNK